MLHLALPTCSSAAPSPSQGGSLLAELADHPESYPKFAPGVQPLLTGATPGLSQQQTAGLPTGGGCWPMPLPALVFSQRGRNVAYPVERSPMSIFPACPGMQAFWVPDDACPGVCMTVRPALRESAPCLDDSLQATYVFKSKGVYRLCVRSPACPAPPCPWVKTNVTVTVAGCAAPPGSPPPPLASPAPSPPPPPSHVLSPVSPPRNGVPPGEGGGGGRGSGGNGGGAGASGGGCGAGGIGCGAVGREAAIAPEDEPYVVEVPPPQRNGTASGGGCSVDDGIAASPNRVRRMPRMP